MKLPTLQKHTMPCAGVEPTTLESWVQHPNHYATTAPLCYIRMYVLIELIPLLLQHGHPYLSAMVNNSTLHYDHDRDGTHTQIAGCEANFRGIEHDTYVAIRYENNILTVSYIIPTCSLNQ